jgi:hypothetical protein
MKHPPFQTFAVLRDAQSNVESFNWLVSKLGVLTRPERGRDRYRHTGDKQEECLVTQAYAGKHELLKFILNSMPDGVTFVPVSTQTGWQSPVKPARSTCVWSAAVVPQRKVSIELVELFLRHRNPRFSSPAVDGVFR